MAGMKPAITMAGCPMRFAQGMARREGSCPEIHCGRERPMQSVYLDQIKSFEGYTPKAQWDYAQFTNGYGTRARYAGEVITKAEAEQRFRSEIAEARSIVEKAAPDVDEGTKAALTSLTYNAGSSWVKSGLGDAVRSGDLDRAREIFVQYNKAGGEVLPGLVNRRLQEAAWIGSADGASGTDVLKLAEAAASSGAALPKVPMAVETANVKGDALGELLSSVARGAPGRVGSADRSVTAIEAPAVAHASDALANGFASDLALMATTGTGAGSVLASYRGDVSLRDSDSRDQERGRTSATQPTISS